MLASRSSLVVLDRTDSRTRREVHADQRRWHRRRGDRSTSATDGITAPVLEHVTLPASTSTGRTGSPKDRWLVSVRKEHLARADIGQPGSILGRERSFDRLRPDDTARSW